MKRKLTVILLLVSMFALSVAPAVAFAQVKTGQLEADALEDATSKAEDAVSWVGSAALTVITPLVAAVAYLLSKLFAEIVSIAGRALNMSILTLIVGMADIINSNAAINIAWTVMRDIANAVFLFILIYIGVKTILRASGVNYKRMLGYIIVAAILVNFSMLGAKIVIDISNVMAVEIYKAFGAGVTPPACYDTDFSPTDYDACIRGGITGVFEGYVRIRSFMHFMDLGVEKILFASMIGLAFQAILAFVFFAGAILLVSRFAILVILIVFSPLAFAAAALGQVVPGVYRHWERWVDQLLKQSFFAPAYLLMLWLSAKVLESLQQASIAYTTGPAAQLFPGESTFFEAVNRPEGTPGYIQTINIFLFFALAAVFLIASLLVARRFGVMGSSTVLGWGRNMRRRAWVGTRDWTKRKGSMAIGYAARQYEQDADKVKEEWKNANAAKRLWLAPKYALTRPIAWSGAARAGVQRTGKLYDAELARMQKKVGQYTTSELSKQYGEGRFMTPNQRITVVQTAAQRREIRDLNPELTRKGIGDMLGTGQVKAVENVVKQAPYMAHLAYPNVEEEKALLHKVLPRMDVEDVRKMNPQLAALKKDNPEAHKRILDAMALKFDGGRAHAVLGEFNDTSRDFAEHLVSEATKYRDELARTDDVKNEDKTVVMIQNYLSDKENLRTVTQPNTKNQSMSGWMRKGRGKDIMDGWLMELGVENTPLPPGRAPAGGKGGKGGGTPPHDPSLKGGGPSGGASPL